MSEPKTGRISEMALRELIARVYLLPDRTKTVRIARDDLLALIREVCDGRS